MVEEFSEEGAEMETPTQSRRINQRHSQTYTNDPDRERTARQDNSPHEP